jgi:hypothetical protein
VFLFVSGAIRRKGIDLLLAAYIATFEAHEGVSLVLALSGSGVACQHNSLTSYIQLAAGDSRSPHVQVITTATGPSQDFASQHTAYLVSAREERVPDEPPPLGKLTGPFTWFEPDFSELARTLRHVYEHREEAKQRGRMARKHVHQQLAWPRITRMYPDRINF